MTTLIVYDSLYGNTEQIAKAISQGIGGEVKMRRTSDVSPADLKSADLLIVGSPTHGGRPSQPTQQLLAKVAPGDLNNVRAAAFDTGIPSQGQKAFMRFIIKFFKYAAPRLGKILESKGATVLAAETFFVLGKEGPLKDGELEKATQWGKRLISEE